MGKTPERGAPRSYPYPYSSSSTVGLRYRRKVPVSSDDDHNDAVPDERLAQRKKSVSPADNSGGTPTAPGSKLRADRKGGQQQVAPRSGDNQREARGDELQTQPAVGDDNSDNQHAHGSPAPEPETGEGGPAVVAPYMKSRKASTSSRKKKHKARLAAASTKESENQQQPHKETAIDVASASSQSSGKHTAVRDVERLRGQEKKLYKRGAQDRELEDSASATSERSDRSSTGSPSGSRNRPGTSSSGKKGGGKHQPSLLKQLLWKAKPQQPKKVHPVAVNADPNGLRPKSPIVASPDRNESGDEDAAEDEEVAFTETQRQARKLKASAAVAATSTTSPPSAAAPAPSKAFVVESSSQETQSGSEDETFLPYNSLVSSAMTPKNAGSVAPLALASTHESPFFPTPFPLGMLTKRALRVHEVLLEDFAFHPTELVIQSGDVVVWCVSAATPGMVEHCLEVVFNAYGSSDEGAGESASSSPLGAGSRFAWRFAAAGCVSVTCSVYNAQGMITVLAKQDEVSMVQAETVEQQQQQQQQEEEIEDPAITRRKLKLQRQKQKQKMKNKLKQKEKRAAAKKQKRQKELQREQGVAEERAQQTGAAMVASEDEIAVFHPPIDLASEMDAGVCRAVLSQLEEVAQFIVVGDVACPVVAEREIQESVETANDVVAGKDGAAASEEGVSNFQQRVIAMLKRSEETQAQHRDSFVVTHSGFDAAATYDFFKRRFVKTKSADENVVYY